jgi:hypothetical protein
MATVTWDPSRKTWLLSKLPKFRHCSDSGHRIKNTRNLVASFNVHSSNSNEYSTFDRAALSEELLKPGSWSAKGSESSTARLESSTENELSATYNLLGEGLPPLFETDGTVESHTVALPVLYNPKFTLHYDIVDDVSGINFSQRLRTTRGKATVRSRDDVERPAKRRRTVQDKDDLSWPLLGVDPELTSTCNTEFQPNRLHIQCTMTEEGLRIIQSFALES